VAVLHNLYPIPFHDEVTSRWRGKKILDFGMADEQLGASCWFHSAFFSDQKLVIFHLEKRFCRHAEMWFPKGGKFTRPGWLNEEDWQGLFDEAVHLGIMTFLCQQKLEITK